ncbi:MAG: hypothetical protein RLO50_22320 [Azospirillaceae bacterium]
MASIFNDASVRDCPFKHALAVGKNVFASGGFGPAINTADGVADPGRLSQRTGLSDAAAAASRSTATSCRASWSTAR